MARTINPRFAKRPVFRGIPVPFFAAYRSDGTPDFKVVEEANRRRCAKERLCWVCGESLGYWMTFIGGPKSASARLYSDGPMHPECAEDAWALCPFLFGRMDYAAHRSDAADFPHALQVTSGIADAKPPEDVVLLVTRGFTVEAIGAEWVFKADAPKRTETRKRVHPALPARDPARVSDADVSAVEG